MILFNVSCDYSSGPRGYPWGPGNHGAAGVQLPHGGDLHLPAAARHGRLPQVGAHHG